MDREDDEKRATPIIDGDARPDIDVNPDSDEIKKREKKSPTESKFESERHGDVNSLEDYKDAKE